MRLEDVGLEHDRTLVEGLRFGNLVPRVVDVGQVDERRHEVGIDLQRAAIRGKRLVEMSRVAIVDRRGGDEFALGGPRSRVRGAASMSTASGGGSGPPELKHFRGLGFEPEIEGQLADARRQQVAHDRAEARAVGQFGIGLPDHRDIGERVGTSPLPRCAGLDEAPLLHVAQVIVSQMLAALEHLTTRDGGGTGSGHAPQL